MPEPIIQPTGTIPITSRTTDETLVKSWGFSHVFTWRDGPRAHYPPHSHGGLTTHLIRKGELTITYPKDGDVSRETFGVGARLDVPAGKVHEVWMGEEGCEYIIGEQWKASVKV